MTKFKKIFLLFIISFIIFNTFKVNFVYADVSLTDDIGNFSADITENTISKTESLRKIIGRFLGFLRVISGLLLVVMIAVTGYKYIVATPDIKVTIKKEGMMVIFGLILVFGAVSISEFIVSGMGRWWIMRKYDKLLVEVILTVCLLFFMPYNDCLAMSDDKADFGGSTPTVSEAMGFVSPSYVSSSNYSELQTTIGYILNFLQVASGITAVVMIAFTGFKLIFEVNPEVVNETKRTMYPIVLGIVLTFGATSIAKFIISALE